MVNVLANSGAIKTREAEIAAVGEYLASLKHKENAKELADRLRGKVPVVYASERMKAVARVWKIKFNENCKIMSFCNSFPELNHNEMVGYTNLPKGLRML